LSNDDAHLAMAAATHAHTHTHTHSERAKSVPNPNRMSQVDDRTTEVQGLCALKLSELPFDRLT